MNPRINRKWFKNRLEAGELEYIASAQFSDDHDYDRMKNYGIVSEFTLATKVEFPDWSVSGAIIYGDKAGVINYYIGRDHYALRVRG